MLISSMKVTCESFYIDFNCVCSLSKLLPGWGALYTAELMTFATQSLASVKNAKFVLLLFTLELKGVWVQRSSNDTTYVNLVLHGMQWILLHALSDFVTTHSLCMIIAFRWVSRVLTISWSRALAISVMWPSWYELFTSRTLRNLLNDNADSLLLNLSGKKRKRNPGCVPSWKDPNLCSDLLSKTFLVESDYWLAVIIFQLHDSSIIGLI